MDNKQIARDLFNLTEDTIYLTLQKFQKNQIVDKSFVYCFTKAFYIHTVKLYNNTKLDFSKIYFEYKEYLKQYYKTNNPTIENELLDQILNFFDNSFSLIDTVEISNMEDSYEFRHYTINIFELLRIILENKSKATIRENIFDNDIRMIIEETDRILDYIKKI